MPHQATIRVRADVVLTVCLEAISVVRSSGLRSLDFVLRRARHLHSSERRAVAERIFAVVRQRELVEFVATRHLPNFSELPPTRRDLWRLAFSRVLSGDEPGAVARDAHLRPSDAQILAAALAPRTLTPAQRLRIEASMPEFVARKFEEQFGAEALAAATAMNVRAPLCIRANTLRLTREVLAQRLLRERIKSKPGALSSDALICEGRENLFGLSAFREGLFEIQDEGSQLLGALVDAPPRTVVDACAGRGGKSLQLAAQMRNRGDLYCLDVDEERLQSLKLRARRAGAHNVRILALDRATGWSSDLAPLMGTAERVLVDAPCSGSGTFRRHPDARYELDAPTLAQYVATQKQLLNSFSRLTKPGGWLVYGTCSVFGEENMDVVEEFLAAHSDFKLRPGNLPIDAAPALHHDGTLRLYPHLHGTDGFFGAVLERQR